MPRTPTDLAPYLTAAKVSGVHVGVRETLAHGFQRRVKGAWCNALAGRPGDICGSNRPGNGSFSGRRAGWLTAVRARSDACERNPAKLLRIPLGERRK